MSDAPLHMIAPRGLALSFILAIVAFSCRVDNSLMMMLDVQGILPSFLGALCAGALLGCAALANKPESSIRTRLIWSNVGTACSVAGLAIIGFVQVFPTPESALAGGILLGFGLAVLLCQWWLTYASFPTRTLFSTTCASFLLASVIWYALRHVSSFLALCFCLIVCALCGGLLSLLPLMPATKDADETAQSEAENLPASSSNGRLRFGQPAFFATIGMLFNFFTLGLTFWPTAAGLSATSIGYKPLSYLAIAVGLLLFMRHAPLESRRMASFSHVALPVAAAIVLASPFIGLVVDLDALPFLSSLTYVGVALFNVLGFALPLYRAGDTHRVIVRIAAAYLSGCVLAMAAGMLVFGLLGQSAQVVSLCIMAAYLAGLVIVSARWSVDNSAQKMPASEVLTQPSMPQGVAKPESMPSDMRAAACERVASSYALSPREAEILQFLARGHGAKYIAGHLYISADTVRTHCKRIYEKTGVHAKDELLELVERAE